MGAGTLAVNLIARTAQFRSDMRGATGVVGRFSSSVTGIGRKMAGAFGIGGLLSGGGLILAMKQQIDSIDALGKKSKLLGLTSEELSEMGFHARKSGLEMRAFEMGVQRAIRKVGELTRGVGEGAKALTDLGFSAADFAGLTGGESVTKILDALSKEMDASVRLSKAQKIFDSEGIALLNLGGRANIEAGRAEGRGLGATITAEQVVRAVEAKDAMERLSTTLDAAVRDIALDAMPGLTLAIDALTVWVRSLDMSFPDAAGKLGDAFQGVGIIIKALELGIATAGAFFAPLFATQAGIDASEKARADKQRELNELKLAPDFSKLLNDQRKASEQAAADNAKMRADLAAAVEGGPKGPNALTGGARFSGAAIVGTAAFGAALVGELTDKQLVEMKKQNALLARIEANLQPAVRRIPPQGQAVFG